MSQEQRKSILQILYEARSDPSQPFDGEVLARLIGKPPHEIQPDIAYLEEKGYIITKRRQIESLIFHRLSITTQGIDLVEGGISSLRRIEVFISSPRDVYEERQIVKRIIERCNRIHAFAERYVLRLQAYEESAPAEVGNRPQTIIDTHMMKASSSDLFICILWHRMGSPFIHKETGERFQSGTEYEFLDAYRHNQLHGKPYMLLYRGMKPFPPEVDAQQLGAVEAFFRRFEGEHTELEALYKTYQSNEQFEDILFHDIDIVLSKNLIL